MGEKPETSFTRIVLRRLRSEVPNIWVVKTQMVSLVGVPDLIGCVNGRFFAWELKVGDNKASMLQKHTLKLISKAGGEASVITPENFELALDYLKLYGRNFYGRSIAEDMKDKFKILKDMDK